MRVAFLHLDLSGGPEERKLALLHKAIGLAAEQGANWIVTPEMMKILMLQLRVHIKSIAIVF